MTFSATLEQARAINADAGCFLVEAPPGSGKTRVLAERVSRLLRESPNSTFRVLALTFTTKAASGLLERIRSVSQEAPRRLTADTFHGFALSLLKLYGERTSFPCDCAVVDEDDRRRAMVRAFGQLGETVPERRILDDMLQRIGRAKRTGESGNTQLSESDRAHAAAYQSALHAANARDFDDLLKSALELLRSSPRIAAHYRSMYRFIVVDEAQDISPVQYDILLALRGPGPINVMLVGDAHQSIYRFAGADPRFLQDFARDFGAETIQLKQNFRNARQVQLAATRLREGAEAPFDAIPDVAEGEVYAQACSSPENEASVVARGIKSLLTNGLKKEWVLDESTSIASDDICILARNRNALEQCRRELRDRGIEHFFSAGERGLFDSDAAKLLHVGMRLLSNPRDDMAREVLAETWELAVSPDSDLASLLDQLQTKEPAIRPITTLLEQGKVSNNVTALASRGAIVLDELGGGADGAAVRNDAHLWAERWAAYRDTVPGPQRTWAGLLSAVSVAGRSAPPLPGIRVLTIHAAKGLEFPAVFLVGMNERTFPDHRAVEKGEEAIADERNSAFVAVTRAGRLLVLTRATTRQTSWGATEQTVESRFVAEMGLKMRAVSGRKATENP